ncbi:MAG: hypothetical protein WCJ58_07530 [bacterium]
MTQSDLKAKLSQIKIFSIQDIFTIDPDFQMNTLYDWEKKDLVVKLRNKRYLFADFLPSKLDLYYIANKLYSPSYISLESALSYYGIIAENSNKITSISTNKTLAIDTKFGIFEYKIIDEKFFFGYEIKPVGNNKYNLASLEKAIIDFCFINPNISSFADLESLKVNLKLLKEKLDLIKIKVLLNQIKNEVFIERMKFIF